MPLHFLVLRDQSCQSLGFGRPSGFVKMSSCPCRYRSLQRDSNFGGGPRESDSMHKAQLRLFRPLRVSVAYGVITSGYIQMAFNRMTSSVEDMERWVREIVVDYCGEIMQLDAGNHLSFGRGADLDIDDNPFLHRRLGVLKCIDDVWWLENVGAQIPITIADVSSSSQVVVAPQRKSPITFPEAVLRFSAGSSNYEIGLRQPSVIEPATEQIPEMDFGSTTVRVSAVTLNDEQRLLLVALALPLLRNPQAQDRPLPSNVEAARRLGWTLTKFNRKLDYLCVKFDKAGFRGLIGQTRRTCDPTPRPARPLGDRCRNDERA